MGNILASGIADFPDIVAFDEMVEARLAAINVEAVLIYLIDIVDSDALYLLAEQFDVLGFKGYNLAPTEADKRAVIKKAIELHRFKGTPWSIKEALKAIGYYTAVIEERLISDPILYNGVYNHNGSQVFGYGHWADFRVTIDLGNDSGVTDITAAAAIALINEYKNVRSRLRDISYTASIQEYVEVTEAFTLNVHYDIVESFSSYYDGYSSYNGTIDHAGDIGEELTVIIEE